MVLRRCQAGLFESLSELDDGPLFGRCCVFADLHHCLFCLDRAHQVNIWLSVLGGQSDIAREIFLANLPNIRVAHHDGAIAVSLPALEAQTFLHDQFCALLHAGVSEVDAIKEIHALSLICGMAADAWW